MCNSKHCQEYASQALGTARTLRLEKVHTESYYFREVTSTTCSKFWKAFMSTLTCVVSRKRMWFAVDFKGLTLVKIGLLENWLAST